MEEQDPYAAAPTELPAVLKDFKSSITPRLLHSLPFNHHPSISLLCWNSISSVFRSHPRGFHSLVIHYRYRKLKLILSLPFKPTSIFYIISITISPEELSPLLLGASHLCLIFSWSSFSQVEESSGLQRPQYLTALALWQYSKSFKDFYSLFTNSYFRQSNKHLFCLMAAHYISAFSLYFLTWYPASTAI